jgi:hypothetical protein
MTKTFRLAASLATKTKHDSDSLLQMVLPKGRNVELCSKEGAHEFVDTVGTDFISTNLTTINSDELTCAYMMMIALAEYASTEKIASGIPESELRTFINTRGIPLICYRPQLASIGYTNRNYCC